MDLITMRLILFGLWNADIGHLSEKYICRDKYLWANFLFRVKTLKKPVKN
jgi:hypothetical protein